MIRNVHITAIVIEISEGGARDLECNFFHRRSRKIEEFLRIFRRRDCEE